MGLAVYALPSWDTICKVKWDGAVLRKLGLEVCDEDTIIELERHDLDEDEVATPAAPPPGLPGEPQHSPATTGMGAGKFQATPKAKEGKQAKAPARNPKSERRNTTWRQDLDREDARMQDVADIPGEDKDL